MPGRLLLDGRPGRWNDGHVSDGYGAAGGAHSVDISDQRDWLGWRAVSGTGRAASGSGVQVISVGMDDARGVRGAPWPSENDLDRAGMEDAVVEQGHSA